MNKKLVALVSFFVILIAVLGTFIFYLPTRDYENNIICWGDSLTVGAGSEQTFIPSKLQGLVNKLDIATNGVTPSYRKSYPSDLQDTLNDSVYDSKVVNMGVGGEGAYQIGMRMGVYPIYVGEFTIPSEKKSVEIDLYKQNLSDTDLLLQGDIGVNPCSINGVAGEITYDSGNDKYFFTRFESGSVVNVEKDTRVITDGMDYKGENYTQIIFAGTNDSPDSKTVNDLIIKINDMINYLDADKYIVIGLTSKAYMPDIEGVNSKLAEEYGAHFLDIRKYILEDGLADANITITNQDKIDLENGEIPTSLRIDEVHGTTDYYEIISEQVYKKITDLGYLQK